MAAEIIIAGVSGLLQALEVWMTARDRHGARAAFKSEYSRITADSLLQAQARTLESLVPGPVLESLKDRVERCWERYQEVLDDEEGYLPGEVDSATSAVKRCVCRELRRIKDINGSIPPGKLSEYWSAYCVGANVA